MFRVIKLLCLFASVLISAVGMSQTGSINGKIISAGIPLESVSIILLKDSLPNKATISNQKGRFEVTGLEYGNYILKFSAIGYQPLQRQLILDQQNTQLNIELLPQLSSLGEVVVTGTLKPVIRSESPVPVEVYTPQFFKKNPSPSIFEALQNVNGVRPQINCSVCNKDVGCRHKKFRRQ